MVRTFFFNSLALPKVSDLSDLTQLVPKNAAKLLANDLKEKM